MTYKLIAWLIKLIICYKDVIKLQIKTKKYTKFWKGYFQTTKNHKIQLVPCYARVVYEVSIILYFQYCGLYAICETSLQRQNSDKITS